MCFVVSVKLLMACLHVMQGQHKRDTTKQENRHASFSLMHLIKAWDSVAKPSRNYY